MKNNQQGYTLVELLIVIAFFGVVLPVIGFIGYAVVHFVSKFW